MRAKSRLKNCVTAVHLLQCKTNFLICLCFLHSSMQVKKHPFWEAFINIKKKIFFDLFTLVYISLHLSTFVQTLYNRLDQSSNLSTLVFICLDLSSGSSPLIYISLVTHLHSSTFVYTRLDSSTVIYICLVTRLHSSLFVYTCLDSSRLIQ